MHARAYFRVPAIPVALTEMGCAGWLAETKMICDLQDVGVCWKIVWGYGNA